MRKIFPDTVHDSDPPGGPGRPGADSQGHGLRPARMQLAVEGIILHCPITGARRNRFDGSLYHFSRGPQTIVSGPPTPGIRKVQDPGLQACPTRFVENLDPLVRGDPREYNPDRLSPGVSVVKS